MKRKRRKLAAIICALTLALSSAVPVYACTPPLKTPSVEIPDINFQPDGALKDAISNAAKNWISKCILGTPTVEYASYYKSTSRYFNYSYVAVKWSEVENATSYKVRITKTDGTWEEYDTTYTAFYSINYTDGFVANGMDGASGQEYPEGYSYDSIEIQSETEPYGLTVFLKDESSAVKLEDELQVNADMTFDLIGNLGTIDYKTADSKEIIVSYER